MKVYYKLIYDPQYDDDDNGGYELESNQAEEDISNLQQMSVLDVIFDRVRNGDERFYDPKGKNKYF